MSNDNHELPDSRLPDLLIRSDLACPPSKVDSRQPQIFAPWLDLLPEAQRDLLSILPVLDINGSLLAALRSARVGENTGPRIAAVLCVDPFLRLHDMTRFLRAAGITAVTNFPTVQIVDGTAARGFESADLGVEREVATLHQFLQEGFAVTGFATSRENALRMTGRGIRDLVIHPGPPSSDWRNRATAGQIATTILTALRDEHATSLRLFSPEEYGQELDTARDCADGLVRYG